MDKMKGLAKGGWHPSGDKAIRKDTWKSDLKGIATGRNKDPYEEQRNHQSAPLSSLKDPDSFGPPPKHNAYSGTNAVARTSTGLSGTSNSASSVGGPSGGWGAPVVESGYAQRKREQEEAERKQIEQQQLEQSTTRGPYQKDTTGLRTDNLPKPPVRRGTPVEGSGAANTRAAPVLPSRQNTRPLPIPPPRQNNAPPPVLPPRQNEYPDENTPPPPPPYQEALQQTAVGARSQAKNPGLLSQGPMQRLGQAGVAVPGFGIGAGGATQDSLGQGQQSSQLNELQQRFARMNTGAGQSAPAQNTATTGGHLAGMATQIAAQKKPPPPPPKKTSLSVTASSQAGEGSSNQGNASNPPPIPLSSKPRGT